KLSWTENGKAEEWTVAYGDQTITADTNEDFVLEGLEPETTYSIKVRPSCDENLWSEAIEVTTLKACPVPTNLSISDITSISAVVSWEGEADSYELQYMRYVDNDANRDEASSWTTKTNAVSPCTLTNLESGTSYVVKVKSVCGEHSESAWSQDVSFTTKDFVMGDVNGNGSVDIGDAVCIVNYLVNKQNVIFNTAAVDLNGNEQIDIGDAVMIVNILVGKDNDNNGDTEAPAMNMEATERDPE
nr:fibronectin type III domain-containing protein [Prevotella sp.]